MPDSIRERVERAIAERVFPGCVVGVIKDGEASVLPFGTLSYGEERVTYDTVYDLASVTKSIPLASLAAMLIAEGRLSPNDRVVQRLPELQSDHGATIEDLLRYRVTGVALSRLTVTTFEEVRAIALERGFDGPPGEERYSNLPAFILGLVIERIMGESIALLAHRYFFEPLGMHETTFFPHKDRCAPTEIDSRGEVRGLPHDESTYRFALRRRTVGHAGLFSTAGDLLVFLKALIEGRYPAVSSAAKRGLGWQVEAQQFMGTHADGAFGKTGFTGTSVLCDIERAAALVILSNRTYPHRPIDAASPGSAMNTFRRDIADLVFA